jgi:hypothetical protein
MDQLVVDMWHVSWVNERLPRGLTRGRHMTPPCYGLKVCLESAGVKLGTSGKGKVFV